MSQWQVTVTFVTQAGTTVTRTAPTPVRDQYRSSAIARVIRIITPGNARVVTATAKLVAR